MTHGARSASKQEDHKSINDGGRAEMKSALLSRHGTFPGKIRQILRLNLNISTKISESKEEIDR